MQDDMGTLYDSSVISIFDIFSDLVMKYNKMVFVSYNYNPNILKKLEIHDKDVLIICSKENEETLSRNLENKNIISLSNERRLHSKVYLFFNDTDCEAIVGSFNLTNQGLNDSIEFFRIEKATFNKSGITTSDFGSIECCGLTTNPIMDQIFDFINILVLDKDRINNTRETLSDQLISSSYKRMFVSTIGQKSLIRSVKNEIKKSSGDVTIWYISPFHNTTSFSVLEEMIKDAGKDPKNFKIKIITNYARYLSDDVGSNNFTSDFVSIKTPFKDVEFRFWSITGRMADLKRERIPGRFLHGKMLHIESNNDCRRFTLVTSANFTRSVWGSDLTSNIETGILDKEPKNNEVFNDLLNYIWDPENNLVVDDSEENISHIMEKIEELDNKKILQPLGFQEHFLFSNPDKISWTHKTLPDAKIRIEGKKTAPDVEKITLSFRYLVFGKEKHYNYSEDEVISLGDSFTFKNSNILMSLLNTKNLLIDAVRLRFYSYHDAEDLCVVKPNNFPTEIKLTSGFINFNRLRWKIAQKNQCLIETSNSLISVKIKDNKIPFNADLSDITKLIFRRCTEIDGKTHPVYEKIIPLDYKIDESPIFGNPIIRLYGAKKIPSIYFETHPLIDNPLNYFNFYCNSEMIETIGVSLESKNKIHLLFKNIPGGSQQFSLKYGYVIEQAFQQKTIDFIGPVENLKLREDAVEHIKKIKSKIIVKITHKALKGTGIQIEDVIPVGSTLIFESNDLNKILMNWYIPYCFEFFPFEPDRASEIKTIKPFATYKFEAYYKDEYGDCLFRIFEKEFKVIDRHIQSLQIILSHLFKPHGGPIGIIYYKPNYVHEVINQHQTNFQILDDKKLSSSILETRNDFLDGKISEPDFNDSKWNMSIIPIFEDKTFTLRINTKKIGKELSDFIRVDVVKENHKILIKLNGEVKGELLGAKYREGPIISGIKGYRHRDDSFSYHTEEILRPSKWSIGKLSSSSEENAKTIAARYRLPFWIVEKRQNNKTIREIFLETENIYMWKIMVDREKEI